MSVDKTMHLNAGLPHSEPSERNIPYIARIFRSGKVELEFTFMEKDDKCADWAVALGYLQKRINEFFIDDDNPPDDYEVVRIRSMETIPSDYTERKVKFSW